MGINKSDIKELKKLLETAKKLTGVFPFVVLTHKTCGGMVEVEQVFQNMGAERVFAIENYTPEDHLKSRGRHEDVLRFFHEIIKELEFKAEQVPDPEQEFRDRKQFVLKFIYERDMGSRGDEPEPKADRTYLVRRLESVKIKSEAQRREDLEHFEEKLKVMRRDFECQRKLDSLRFEAEMREYQRQLQKAKKDVCILQ